MNRIINGDVLRFAAHYRGERFHGVLCDPPYELGFMGKSWDSRGVSFRAETWSAIRSLLLPGAHLLAFGGTRTFHRIAVAIEDAGFEIRDTIGFLYGSGFPKSHDVSKAIDREAGAEREVLARHPSPKGKPSDGWGHKSEAFITAPATDSARAWQGYGTALKPAWEPVIVARNPLAGTVAQNAIEHGAGAMNVDGGRVAYTDDADKASALSGDAFKRKDTSDKGWSRPWMQDEQKIARMNAEAKERAQNGRWPANILHDGSDDVAEVMGDAQRFFYCAKASKRERDEGLGDSIERRRSDARPNSPDMTGKFPDHDGRVRRGNHHPTVKPLALTEYLARLIVPPAHVESRLLVPFAGSGSECIGAIRAGWRHVVGVEQNDEYACIARARIEHHSR